MIDVFFRRVSHSLCTPEAARAEVAQEMMVEAQMQRRSRIIRRVLAAQPEGAVIIE